MNLADSGVEYEISPPGRFPSVDWRELSRYRELFIVFAWRDIAVRYKQTAIGALWAVLQPLVTMVVFTCVFSVLLKTESGDGTPYPIFLYVGLLPWQYFSGTLTNAAGSVVTNSALVQKVYFPRLIIPAAAAVTSMVDTAVACLVLAVLMVYYGFSPHLLGLLAAPVLLVTTVFAALGMGLYVAALNVKFRDVRHALPFFIQIAMYVTPVVYPINMLDGHPAAKALMLWLNPMSGVISNARAGILGRSALDWNVMAISLLMSAVFMAFGLCYFRYMERHFADIV